MKTVYVIYIRANYGQRGLMINSRRIIVILPQTGGGGYKSIIDCVGIRVRAHASLE